MSTCHYKPNKHRTKISIHTLASKLTALSTVDEVKAAVADLVSRIEWWHDQSADPIYGDWGKDWCGCRYLLRMVDGSYRRASGTLDEAMSGEVSMSLDFLDGDCEMVDESQIKAWLRLPDNDRFDVEFDGKMIGGV